MTEPIIPRIALLLDRSGSMQSCRAEAAAAVNAYLVKAADDPALHRARLSLITFDSASIDVVRDGVAVNTAKPLDDGEFVPRGATPLLDAVAFAVTHLDRQPGRPDEPRILAIVTDGAESASVEHTRQSVRALLVARQKAGWLVIYLGANQDSWAEARSIGIEAACTADFDLGRFDGVAHGLHHATGRYLTSGHKGFFDADRRRMKAGR